MSHYDVAATFAVGLTLFFMGWLVVAVAMFF